MYQHLFPVPAFSPKSPELFPAPTPWLPWGLSARGGVRPAGITLVGNACFMMGLAGVLATYFHWWPKLQTLTPKRKAFTI